MDPQVATLDSAGMLLQVISNDDLVVEAAEGWEVMVEVSDVEAVPNSDDSEPSDWPDADPWMELGEAD